MSNARNLARLLPNASGQLPDAAMSSGSVIQVATAAFTTNVGTTSSTYQDTGLSLSFTPSFANSTILLLADPACFLVTEPSGIACRFYDATSGSILGYEYNCLRIDYSGASGNVYMYNRASMMCSVASWGTTAKNIKLQFKSIEGGTVEINTVYPSTQQTRLTIMEIAA